MELLEKYKLCVSWIFKTLLYFNGSSSRNIIPKAFCGFSMHFWCLQTSVYLQSVCAHTLAAHFLRLLCLLITVKRSQLETETHQGIKGISVGWCVTDLNRCLLFWYVLWFRKSSKEDVGATPRVSGYESKLLTVWLRLQNYHLQSNDYSFTSFSTLIFFFCL